MFRHNMLSRTICLVFSIFSLCVITGGLHSYADDGDLIIPGERIGEFEVGKDLSSITDDTRSELRSRGIFPHTKFDEIIDVFTTNNKFTTESGLSVGDSKSEVIAVFGEPVSRDLLEPTKPLKMNTINYNGIIFEISPSNTVRGILVFSASSNTAFRKKNQTSEANQNELVRSNVNQKFPSGGGDKDDKGMFTLFIEQPGTGGDRDIWEFSGSGGSGSSSSGSSSSSSSSSFLAFSSSDSSSDSDSSDSSGSSDSSDSSGSSDSSDSSGSSGSFTNAIDTGHAFVRVQTANGQKVVVGKYSGETVTRDDRVVEADIRCDDGRIDDAHVKCKITIPASDARNLFNELKEKEPDTNYNLWSANCAVFARKVAKEAGKEDLPELNYNGYFYDGAAPGPWAEDLLKQNDNAERID